MLQLNKVEEKYRDLLDAGDKPIRENANIQSSFKWLKATNDLHISSLLYGYLWKRILILVLESVIHLKIEWHRNYWMPRSPNLVWHWIKNRKFLMCKPWEPDPSGYLGSNQPFRKTLWQKVRNSQPRRIKS